MIAPRQLLLVHGSADKRITQEQALQLFARAEEPKRLWVIEGATHHSVRQPGLDVLSAHVLEFFDSALKNKPRSITD
jgi:alpha-beta hydrolase superfamily lysophospholipase